MYVYGWDWARKAVRIYCKWYNLRKTSFTRTFVIIWTFVVRATGPTCAVLGEKGVFLIFGSQLPLSCYLFGGRLAGFVLICYYILVCFCVLECGAVSWFLVDMQFLCFYCCVPPCVAANGILILTKSTEKGLAISLQYGTKLGASKLHIIVSPELCKHFIAIYYLT